MLPHSTSRVAHSGLIVDIDISWIPIQPDRNDENKKTNDGGHRQKVAQTLCAPNRVPSGLFPTAPEGSVGSGSLLNPVLEMNFMGPCGSGKQKKRG